MRGEVEVGREWGGELDSKRQDPGAGDAEGAKDSLCACGNSALGGLNQDPAQVLRGQETHR